MNGRVLLDTNIIMALWASEVAVTEQLARASEVFVSVIALGELYYGARKSAWSTNDIELNLGGRSIPSLLDDMGITSAFYSQYGAS